MKAKDIIYLLAIGALAALLLRECARKPQTVEVVRVQTIDLDSLKRTIPPDVVIVPGPERQVLRYVTVTITSKEQADSLMREYDAIAKQFGDLQTELQWRWMSGDGEPPFEIQEPEHAYADSVKTDEYFHRWAITAKGPITSYSFGIIPFCETQEPCPDPKKPARHRIGAYFGGQTSASITRPVYALKYSRGWASVQGGYIPSGGGQPEAGQILVGLEIPIR
jgi:hypothetical protein